MEVQERKVYKCGFCRKYYLMKHACERHEKYCAKNPVNRHKCYSCKFLEVDRSPNDEGLSVKTFYCIKLEKELHTVKAEKLNHSCLGHTERMPLICCHFKSIDIFENEHE
jgi:hypothetical protein